MEYRYSAKEAIMAWEKEEEKPASQRTQEALKLLFRMRDEAYELGFQAGLQAAREEKTA